MESNIEDLKELFKDDYTPRSGVPVKLYYDNDFAVVEHEGRVIIDLEKFIGKALKANTTIEITLKA